MLQRPITRDQHQQRAAATARGRDYKRPASALSE